MTLTPQLEPTDFSRIERVAARQQRDDAFRDNSLYRHEEPQGTRYTKGNVDGTPKRSWQSLDAVLRSDAASSEALPVKPLRRARVFTGLAIASSILFVAGVAATSRDGFSFREITPGNGVLLGGALGSVAFAVLAGVFFRRARVGYDRAVDIYNDSLGLRLGVKSPAGDYKPPADVLVDADGYVITDDPNAPAVYGPAPAPTPTPATGAPALQSQPMPPAPAAPPADTQPPAQPGLAPTQSPAQPGLAPTSQPGAATALPPARAQLSAPSSPRTPDGAGLLGPAAQLHAPLVGSRRPSWMPVGALTLLPQR